MAFLSMFTLCEETYAFPDDAKATTIKEIKEPIDIKEVAKDAKDIIKAAKEDSIKAAKKNKKECAKECGNDYDPVCVHDPADSNFKPRTFGTQCALDVHNCEMGTSKHRKKLHIERQEDYIAYERKENILKKKKRKLNTSSLIYN